MNPRIQVEHTVTEAVTGIDLVKAQIRIADGAKIGDEASGVPAQEDIHLTSHALQCRVTTEDPENNFSPDYGKITAYRSPAGFGIRLDAGTAYAGAILTRSYDSMLVKVTAWAPNPVEAIARMHRALWEFRIRGVATNLRFLDQVITHPKFANAEYTTKFIDETPELFKWEKKRDRATRILSFIGETIVNGNPEVKGRLKPKQMTLARLPKVNVAKAPPPGTKQKLDELGAEGFAKWMLAQERVLITDTTMRDAHQSLLATRMRQPDMTAIAPYYAHMLPQLFSVECWGGATFDVAMRFLREDPVVAARAVPRGHAEPAAADAAAFGERRGLHQLPRQRRARVREAGRGLRRRRVPRVRLAQLGGEHARRHRRRARDRQALRSGDLLHGQSLFAERERSTRSTTTSRWAAQLKAAGTHILGIKDMAGLCQPNAAYTLVKALKDELGLPVHFHTHDTSGIAAASVLAAVAAGCDAVDGAIDAMSGFTSQPNLGSIIEALRYAPRDTGIDPSNLRAISMYWEQVRKNYLAFESDMRSGASEVYVHAMPGGQYTNLKEQARSVGLDDSRWPEVAQAYADVNEMFGNIVKVTPSSKVVGDLALMMVSSGLTKEQVLDPDVEVAFPESVVQMMRGDLGRPEGGWPEGIQKKVLKGQKPLTTRPGATHGAAGSRRRAQEARREVRPRRRPTRSSRPISCIPKVFLDYARDRAAFGDCAILPTPVFFYGMEPGDEVSVDIERGKTLIVRFVAVSEVRDDGTRQVFFELNGQPRSIVVTDRSQVAKRPPQRKMEAGNAKHVGAPMPGTIATVKAIVGQKVAKGDLLLTMEAMKMETSVRAETDGTVAEVLAKPGLQVDAKDLLVVLG